MRRNLEVLVSALEKDPMKLISGMNLECDALIVNQGSRDRSYEYENENKLKIRVFESSERGIGRSRNLALDKADSKIVLFSDDESQICRTWQYRQQEGREVLFGYETASGNRHGNVRQSGSAYLG